MGYYDDEPYVVYANDRRELGEVLMELEKADVLPQEIEDMITARIKEFEEIYITLALAEVMKSRMIKKFRDLLPKPLEPDPEPKYIKPFKDEDLPF